MCGALIYLLAFRDFEVAVLTPFPCICLLLSTERYKRPPLASRHVTNLRTAHRCEGCEEAAPHWTSKKKTSRQWCVTRTHISDIVVCSRVKWQTDLCWWLGKDFVLKMYGYGFTMVLSSGSVYRSAYIYILESQGCKDYVHQSEAETLSLNQESIDQSTLSRSTFIFYVRRVKNKFVLQHLQMKTKFYTLMIPI